MGNLKCLDNTIDDLTQNDELLDSVLDVDVFYFWSCTNTKYKPRIFTWRYCEEISEHPNYTGYKLWLQFYCNLYGYCINIYYPESAKEHEEIKVLFLGAYVRGYVSWSHGFEGLFWNRLAILLFLEKYEQFNQQKSA
jgi:hypothetical protein